MRLACIFVGLNDIKPFDEQVSEIRLVDAMLPWSVSWAADSLLPRFAR